MKTTNPKQPFSYTSGLTATPSSYRCKTCKATKCKLWRYSNIFLDRQSLFCAKCAGKNQKIDTSKIDASGKISRFYNGHNMGPSDQIGSLLPAVPTEENDTFWGYTSVPEPGCIWWRNLPSLPIK